MAIHRDTISEIEVNVQFANDVSEGLISNPKRLSSKYFYDEIGDQLFVQIMNLDEYYLTNSEMEIFVEQSNAIAEKILEDSKTFEIIELGAGDGTKTIRLLEAFKNVDFVYKPLDISRYAVENLERKLENYPWVKTKGLVGDYFKILESLESSNPKLLLFLGSNLGNMTDSQASEFIERIDQVLNPGDFFLLGLDLKKSKEIVGPAYNDSKGVTAKFNLNLLNRINKELGANFDIDKFSHVPNYDEEKGIAYSYIQSDIDQVVHIDYLDEEFHFKKGEKIHTEISRKYDDEILEKILASTSLSIHSKFLDKKGYYCNYLLKKN